MTEVEDQRRANERHDSLIGLAKVVKDNVADYVALMVIGRVIINSATSLKALVPYVQSGNKEARHALKSIRDEIDRVLGDTEDE